MSVLASRVRKLLSVTFDHCFFFCAGPEAPTSCDELECSFGATCIEVSGQAHCECPPPDCDERNKTKVGASNSRLPERLYHSDVSITSISSSSSYGRGAGVRLGWGDLRRPVPAEDHRLQAGQGYHRAALWTVHR